MANPNTETTNRSNGATAPNGAASEFKSKMHGAENQLEKMAHNAGERIGSMASDFTSSTTDSLKSGRDYVQENPVKGVAIAAVAGVVAGSLLTMALRRRD